MNDHSVTLHALPKLVSQRCGLRDYVEGKRRRAVIALPPTVKGRMRYRGAIANDAIMCSHLCSEGCGKRVAGDP